MLMLVLVLGLMVTTRDQAHARAHVQAPGYAHAGAYAHAPAHACVRAHLMFMRFCSVEKM